MTVVGRLVQSERTAGLGVLDILIAACVGAISIASVLAQEIQPGMQEPNAVSLTFVAGAAGSLVLRRMYPLGALVLGGSLIAIPVFGGYPEGLTPFVFYLLVGYMAARCDLSRALIGLVFSTLLVGLLSLWAPYFDLAAATVTLVIVILVWILGAGIRWRLDSAEGEVRVAEQAAEAERLRAEQAVTDERLRIAQELHDVVAHSMSVIAVQAGMGAHVLRDDPEKAQTALDAISDISRSTLTEMRRLLSILRSADGDLDHSPPPSLKDLPLLIADIRAAGLPVTLAVDGVSTLSHPGIELSAFRVVQESLTNVMKHAGAPDEVHVSVRYRPTELAVEIEDNGRGVASLGRAVTTAGAAAGGHGLMGMRERVDVWGGHFYDGPRSGGGYVVKATFPYGDLP